MLPEAWEHVAELISAANADPAEYLEAIRRASGELPLTAQRTLSIYIGYLLRASALLVLQRRPSSDDFHALAASCHAGVARNLRVDVKAIDLTLRTAYDEAPEGQETQPGDFVVVGAATVAAMLSNADLQLDNLKKALTRWWLLHKAELQPIIES